MRFNNYAMALLDIPDLPPRAFIRKADGGIIPQGGGSSPSTTTTTNTGLPDWAKGYAQDTLAKQAALSEVPYEAYGADRIQGFTPMQEQARKDAASMDAGPQGFSQGISAYMSPYQQNVTDIQKREAGRQSDIMGQQQQAQAAQSGAFGGSRDAIMRAERERNLGQQMGDIQARGDQANYEQAANQFRQGITQGMDVNRLQSAYGAQQQALGQQGLTQAYQDFQNQKNYPQQQLSNMASMMRGLPIGSSGTQYQTGTPGSPSFGQMVGSGITGLYGLKNFFADGGSVDSQQNIESIVHKLSDQQLNQAEQAAKVRGDVEQLQAIQTEKAARASMKNGLGALPVDMNKMLPTEQSMARGGIVAFAGNDGSMVSEDDGGGGDETTVPAQGPGNPTVYNEALQNQMAQAKALADSKYEPMDPKEYDQRIEARRASLIAAAGENPYASMREDIKRMTEDSATNLKHGKGLAALQAAAAMLEGNSLPRALVAGAKEFGGAYSAAVKADQAQKDAVEKMKFNIADAERKERLGFTKDAMAAADQARKDHQDEQRAKVEKIKALGVVYSKLAAAAKPGAVKAPTPPKAAELAIQSGVATRMAREKPKQGETSEMMKDRITSEESNRVLAMQQQKVINSTVSSTGDIGENRIASLEAQQNITRQGLENAMVRDAARTAADEIKADTYQPKSELYQAIKNKDLDAQRIIKERINNEHRTKLGLPPIAAAVPAAVPAAAPTAAKPMSATDFHTKWATLKSGQKLVGPDGVEYIKK